jgi:transposase InsO family protein
MYECIYCIKKNKCTSDRGTQFTSSLWAALCSLISIQHSQTTAYHPQSNGMVERFHHCLKDALRAHCAAANWVDHFPWFLVGLRTAAIEYDGTTPAQAVFGSRLILLGQFLDSPDSGFQDSYLQKIFLSNSLRH